MKTPNLGAYTGLSHDPLGGDHIHRFLHAIGVGQADREAIVHRHRVRQLVAAGIDPGFVQALGKHVRFVKPVAEIPREAARVKRHDGPPRPKENDSRRVMKVPGAGGQLRRQVSSGFRAAGFDPGEHS